MRVLHTPPQPPSTAMFHVERPFTFGLPCACEFYTPLPQLHRRAGSVNCRIGCVPASLPRASPAGTQILPHNSFASSIPAACHRACAHKNRLLCNVRLFSIVGLGEIASQIASHLTGHSVWARGPVTGARRTLTRRKCRRRIHPRRARRRRGREGFGTAGVRPHRGRARGRRGRWCRLECSGCPWPGR